MKTLQFAYFGRNFRVVAEVGFEKAEETFAVHRTSHHWTMALMDSQETLGAGNSSMRGMADCDKRERSGPPQPFSLVQSKNTNPARFSGRRSR